MNLLLGKQGVLSVMSPSTLVFCFLRLRDQTKTPTALTGGPISYSEVNALCLISIASFIDHPHHPRRQGVSGDRRGGGSSLVAAICI